MHAYEESKDRKAFSLVLAMALSCIFVVRLFISNWLEFKLAMIEMY